MSRPARDRLGERTDDDGEINIENRRASDAGVESWMAPVFRSSIAAT
jgi:hypothetical protein